MPASKNMPVAATAALKVFLAMLVGSLLLSSCGGQAEPADADTSSSTQAIAAAWSTDDFEDLVAHCDKVYSEPSSSDEEGSGIGPVEVDCQIVVRQNLEEFGCPVEGTYEVIEETRRLIGLDIQFDSEDHTSGEAWDHSLQMQAELDDAYALAGCQKSLVLNW